MLKQQKDTGIVISTEKESLEKVIQSRFLTGQSPPGKVLLVLPARLGGLGLILLPQQNNSELLRNRSVPH